MSLKGWNLNCASYRASDEARLAFGLLDSTSARVALQPPGPTMPPRAGQIFLTRAVSDLLVDEELGELLVRDLGEVPLRRSEDAVRAYELVVPA